jgi:hydroxyacylglutathione hydrolase
LIFGFDYRVCQVGYFFEGNSADMVAAIRKILSSVKHPQTQFFAGHDYAMQFYPEAAKRDPSNTFIAEKLRWAESMKAQQLPAMPTTLQDELETNLFVQCVTNMPQVGKRYPGWDPATGPVGLMELVYNSF